jgi:hypothetical protein
MINRVCFLVFVLLFSIGVPTNVSAKPHEKWWLQSSLADTTKSLLFHASGKYSYTKMKGALSGEMQTGDINLAERQRIITNFSAYGIDKMDLTLKVPTAINFNTTSYYFTDYIDVDITKVLFGQIGFIWERDNILLIQNRYSYYSGLGLNLSLRKKLKLKSLFAAGRINQEYSIPVDNFNVIKEPYTAFYCVHNVDYTISPVISMSGQVFYFKDMDVSNRYRYGMRFNLMVGIAKHVNLVIGYNYKYDNENALLGIMPDFSTQNLGIEVSL